MEREVGEYVAACPLCAQSKVSRHPPPGLLCPLPLPHLPWSDISLDFVTMLQASFPSDIYGYRFSDSCPFTPDYVFTFSPLEK